jgi:2-amino-4-hydroxy-6-hydroxymethyldihydropteridine diphosphokinase
MIDVFVGLGSNLGDRESHILAAASKLQTTLLSPVYESDPWGVDSHPPYLNAVALCRTDWAAEQFLHRVQELEIRHGRIRTAGPPTPRTLDIDVLTFGDYIRGTAPVTPHPRLHLRAFVLRPWRDIAPDFVVPGFNKTISQIYDDLDEEEKSSVRPYFFKR